MKAAERFSVVVLDSAVNGGKPRTLKLPRQERSKRGRAFTYVTFQGDLNAIEADRMRIKKVAEHPPFNNGKRRTEIATELNIQGKKGQSELSTVLQRFRMDQPDGFWQDWDKTRNRPAEYLYEHDVFLQWLAGRNVAEYAAELKRENHLSGLYRRGLRGVEIAIRFLKKILARCDLPVQEAMRLGKEKRIGSARLRNAYKLLNVESVKDTIWHLPKQLTRDKPSGKAVQFIEGMFPKGRARLPSNLNEEVINRHGLENKLKITVTKPKKHSASQELRKPMNEVDPKNWTGE